MTNGRPSYLPIMGQLRLQLGLSGNIERHHVPLALNSMVSA